MRKTKTTALVALLVVVLAITATLAILAIPARKPEVIVHVEEVCYYLDQLKKNITGLPSTAFSDEKASAEQRKALLNEVDAVLLHVEACEKQAAINKLWNDIYDKIEKWIVKPYQSDLLNIVSRIAVLLLDPVRTDAGLVSGEVLGELGKEVRVYRGIPYAAPPVGDLRWKPPQPVTPWKGIKICTEFSKAPMQAEQLWCPPPYSEDCLYLNVLTPAKKETDRLPVMVWFHGGGFSIGSGNMKPWATSLSLPQHGVVLVTVNHRLGPMGLLALPALSKESPHGVSGNYLFLDLIAALQWVQKNIAAFGGDPNCVTIFGESGGAGKVDALLASPLAKGLFHRAILESGANAEGVGPKILTLKEAEALGEMLVTKYLGIDPNDLAALRAIPAEKIIKAAMNLTRDLGAITVTGVSVIDAPVVDGWFLPDYPTNIFKAGKQNNVPFIVCANLGELIANKTFLRMPQLIKAYVDRLSSASKLGTKAYACIFSHVPSKWRKEGVLAYHGIEIPYVFGDLERLKEPLHFYIFARPSGATQPDPGLTEEDKWVAEAMMTMWVQFAKTGDPSVEGLVTWPAWEPTTDQYLEIAWPLQVRSGFSKIVKP